MNKELKKGKLLNASGNLSEAGFAYDLVREYKRSDIKGLKTRIKEWDYYEFNTKDYGVALTIADNSYMAMVSVSVMDFKNKTSTTKSYIKFFSFGKLNMPSTSKKGDAIYEDKKWSFKFLNDGKIRHIICYFKNFKDNKDFKCDLIVDQTTNKTMVIATPFKKNKHFYYNQKINNLICNGTFSIGDFSYNIKDGLGVLDWGRGIWTYKNTWYWSSCSSKDENGNYIGFNLGYGFGDTSAASENMLFVNKEAYKLDDVLFEIPTNEKGEFEYMKPWKFTSKNGDINLSFKPLIDRKDNMNLLVLASFQHQVFGVFNGYIKAQEKKIEFKNVIAFAERVTNKW